MPFSKQSLAVLGVKFTRSWVEKQQRGRNTRALNFGRGGSRTTIFGSSIFHRTVVCICLTLLLLLLPRYYSIDEAIENGAAPILISLDLDSAIDAQCTIDVMDHPSSSL
ncbi:N-alpha-acetyltransferase 35, NatC auxiliary subunit-like protein [Corchorus olitorius]|uniref:N-alpha-acetyltransferase 35, NatC auxiliary subunit-like protein n=1 Tax=Corchorus olitorius TaxID=93759 RepID=A0A1R3KLB1_9ROSI|nr:N-alpha-acetyltransferase 35, NatC auxiliary subunit-like protein [Corchorus olitorius]